MLIYECAAQIQNKIHSLNMKEVAFLFFCDFPGSHSSVIAIFESIFFSFGQNFFFFFHSISFFHSQTNNVMRFLLRNHVDMEQYSDKQMFEIEVSRMKL